MSDKKDSLLQSVFRRQLPPGIYERHHLRIAQRFVDHKQRFAVYCNITRIPKGRQHGIKMRRIIFDAPVMLFDQGIPVCNPMYKAPPAFIGPGQRKREIRLTAGQDFIKRTFQQPPAVAEPIVPVNKAFDSVFAGHIRLRLPCFRNPQVIVSQISRDTGLVMGLEITDRLAHVGPFGKTFPPPLVIFRYRVELRKVQRQYSRFHSSSS